MTEKKPQKHNLTAFPVEAHNNQFTPFCFRILGAFGDTKAYELREQQFRAEEKERKARNKAGSSF